MANELVNPFPLVGYHGAAYFCDRETETANLETSIQSGVNVTLVSLRRMGKTSLLSHIQARRTRKKQPTIIADLQATTGLGSLTEALANSAVRALHGPGRKFMDGMREVASRIGASVSVNAHGDASLVFAAQDRRVSMRDDLQRVMAMIEAHPLPVLVIMDEFQEIGGYADDNAEGILRAVIQTMPRTRFIFSGSRKAMIENMFSDHRRPFYASTRHMELGALPDESYREFVREWFRSTRRTISDEAFALIRMITEGRTFHMQLVANRLWDVPGKSIDVERAQHTISDIVAEQSHLFIGFRSLLTTGQWSLLAAIARERRVAMPLAEAFRREHALPAASSLKRALQALTERELVYAYADGYGVEDPFFAQWLRTTFARP